MIRLHRRVKHSKVPYSRVAARPTMPPLIGGSVVLAAKRSNDDGRRRLKEAKVLVPHIADTLCIIGGRIVRHDFWLVAWAVRARAVYELVRMQKAHRLVLGSLQILAIKHIIIGAIDQAVRSRLFSNARDHHEPFWTDGEHMIAQLLRTQSPVYLLLFRAPFGRIRRRLQLDAHNV